MKSTWILAVAAAILVMGALVFLQEEESASEQVRDGIEALGAQINDEAQRVGDALSDRD